MLNLGHEISPTRVSHILKEQGIEPAPDRGRQTSWQTFLRAHWPVLAAIDFTTIEVWTQHGLVSLPPFDRRRFMVVPAGTTRAGPA